MWGSGEVEAFMVACGVWEGNRVSLRCEQDEREAGDHKGPPCPTSPRSPLRMLMGLFFD